jgi:cyclin H
MLSADHPLLSQPESNKLVRPLIRKLKKCRDPDRWDLVALQKAKREQAIGRKGSDADIEDTGDKAQNAANGDQAKGRDAKRRKMEDPFGGPI